MRKLFLLILILIYNNLQSQQHSVDTTTSESLDFIPLIYANRHLTYITFFEGLGNLPPLLTEMGVSSSYFFRKNNVWALEGNLNMVLRVRNENSYPVMPPSYHPVITYYREIKHWNKTALSKILLDNAYWEASLGHHSNGKSGYFFKRDSLGNRTNGIDLDNGNFSTDYVELAISTYDYRTATPRKYVSSLRLAFKLYPPVFSSIELKDIYGFYRLFATYNIFGVPNVEQENRLAMIFSRSRLKIHSGWIFGKMSTAETGEVSKRLVAGAEWHYYPKWLAELGFFIQYYRGQDYYNVQFERTVEMLRIGISANPTEIGWLNNL